MEGRDVLESRRWVGRAAAFKRLHADGVRVVLGALGFIDFWCFCVLRIYLMEAVKVAF